VIENPNKQIVKCKPVTGYVPFNVAEQELLRGFLYVLHGEFQNITSK